MISVIFVKVVAAANQGAATPRLASSEVTRSRLISKGLTGFFVAGNNGVQTELSWT
jgi:hypothetical protein